jgi:hypothetical protein
MTADTTTAAGRDRLFLQRERERLASIAETRDVLESLAVAVCERLDALDLADDALAFDAEGVTDREPNPFRGLPRPALQIRLSGIVMELQGAVGQLRDHARQLQREARRVSNPWHLERIGRGFEALAAEGRRVFESYGPGRDELIPDWDRINAIHAGVRELERRQEAELRENLAATLRDHDQRQRNLRAAGLAELADRLNTNPALQRALQVMREFVDARLPT